MSVSAPVSASAGDGESRTIFTDASSCGCAEGQVDASSVAGVCGTGYSLKEKKPKPIRTKPRAELDRARKTEAKGTKGLKTELKRTFPDRLDNVCAFNKVKTKSKSTPGYCIGKSMEKRTRNPIMIKWANPYMS
ncbi:hypothetical protein Tco_1266025 [Tanacetum coccineum]